MSIITGQSTVFVVFFSLTVLSLIILFRIRPKGHLPKYRVARACKPTAQTTTLASNLPSIVKRQYGFLRNSRAIVNHRSLFYFISWLDELFLSSGTSLSFFHLVLFFVLFSILILYALFWLFYLSLFYALPIALLLSGFFILQILLRQRARHLRNFQSIFPDALDLIVRSVRAGLPVSESIKMIGTEVADPVGSAFRTVAANLSIGLSLDESLVLLEKRMPIPEVKFFAISLTIQQETGGNLAEILSNLSSIMRKRVQIGKKIRALSSEARASALIIGALPFIVGLVIFFMNRDYIEILYLNDTGQVFLFGAMISMALGGVVMAKLIRFEI